MNVKEKLNALERSAKFNAENWEPVTVAGTKDILAIAAEFRALEQRAEAVEEKLVELEKQKPIGTVSIAMDWNTHRNIATVNMRPDLVVAEMKDGDELFTRPAPAVSMADLVPAAWRIQPGEGPCQLSFRCPEDLRANGYDFDSAEELFTRAEILRNIEEAK